MKKRYPYISEYYKSKGTPIYRDTTSLPFRGGGPVELGCPPGMIFQNGNCIPNPTSLINTSGPRVTAPKVDKDAMSGMMKARLAYEEMHGNPAAKRMVAPTDNPYNFGDGDVGTHYMGSYDNYAIPNIQNVDGKLEMTGPKANEAIKFDRPEDADYFAKNYKDVSPAFNESPEKLTVEPKVEEDPNLAYEYWKNTRQPIDKFGQPNINYTGPTSLTRDTAISGLIQEDIDKKAKNLEDRTTIVTDFDDDYHYKRIFNKDGTTSYYTKDLNTKNSKWKQVEENSLNLKPIKAKVFNTDPEEWYGTQQQKDWDQKIYEKEIKDKGEWFGPIDETKREEILRPWYDPENKGADIIGSGEAPNIVLNYAQDKNFIDAHANSYFLKGRNDGLYKQLLSGKWGYNPSTGAMYRLGAMGEAGKSRIVDNSQDPYVQDVLGYLDDPEYYEKQKRKEREPLVNFLKDRHLVHIEESEGWRPHVEFGGILADEVSKDADGWKLKNSENFEKRGLIDLYNYGGKDVYMTDKEEAAYKKAMMAHNVNKTWNSSIFKLPGAIFFGALGTAGLMASTGEATLAGAIGQSAIPQIARTIGLGHGVSSVINPESDLRQSWTNVIDNPTSENILDAAGETALTGTEFVVGGPSTLKALKGSSTFQNISKGLSTPISKMILPEFLNIAGIASNIGKVTSIGNYVTPAQLLGIGFAHHGVQQFSDSNSSFNTANERYNNLNADSSDSEWFNATVGAFGENALQGLNFFGAGEFLAKKGISGINATRQFLSEVPVLRSSKSAFKDWNAGKTSLQEIFSLKKYNYTTNDAQALKSINKHLEAAQSELKFAKKNHTLYTKQEILDLERNVENISTRSNFLEKSTENSLYSQNGTKFGYNQFMSDYEAKQSSLLTLEQKVKNGIPLTLGEKTAVKQSIAPSGERLTNFINKIDRSDYGYTGSKELLEKEINYLAGKQTNYWKNPIYTKNRALQRIMDDAPVNPNEMFNIHGRNKFTSNFQTESLANQQYYNWQRNLVNQLNVERNLLRSDMLAEKIFNKFKIQTPVKYTVKTAGETNE